ncbi:MAG: phospho-sugar mutase [Clostridia bacterium]|nr:phospho-sugar mutase [Clostridia bacterium]
MFLNEKYELWLKNATADPDIVAELLAIKDDAEAINDRFYKDLAFGTGGLRGVIGAGTNRMNIYTVGRATQGLAEYVNSVSEKGKVAIAYDSRIKSDTFAKHSAAILAANGIKVYIYPELMPTPMLSYAVRYFNCDAGIVITASHNPAIYNGYKAYGPDGSQLNLEASEYVLSIMNKVDIFSEVKTCDFDEAVALGKIEFIGEDVIDSYLENVKAQQVNADIFNDSDIKIVYTPLHGAGNKPVRAILKRIGLKDVTVVPEQELPNGNFPTAPYPNPELRQPFECALALAETLSPDLLLATDPDCDRVGIAVRHEGEFKLLTGNQVGALLLNYILSQKVEKGTLPKNPIAVKTIVTTELCQKIADKYGCELINVLTGFKFIGEQIGLLEAKGEMERYQFGFEESYGYLAGGYVRDKDAVVASMLICEMVCFYKKQGKNLIEVLNGLYEEFGYYNNSQVSFTFEGQTGMEKMAAMMKTLCAEPPKAIAGSPVKEISNYIVSEKTVCATGEKSVINLPKSDVLEYVLESGSSVIIRPSGTEPKIKVYVSSVGTSEADAKSISDALAASVKGILGIE